MYYVITPSLNNLESNWGLVRLMNIDLLIKLKLITSGLVASFHILAFTSNQKPSSNAHDNIKIFQLNPLVRSDIFQNSSEVCWQVQTFFNKEDRTSMHLCFLICIIFQLWAHKHRIRDRCYISNWLTMKLWVCFMI